MASLPLSLLAGRRSVLLEQTGADGVSVRRRVPLAHMEAERHLAVRAAGGPAALAVGEAVTLSVPLSGSVWRLATTVLAAAPSDGAQLVLLDWPSAAERTAGRRHPRVAVACAVRVKVPGHPRHLCSYTLDVSGTGLQFALPVTLATGQPLDVELRCGGNTIALVGEVRWQRDASSAPGDPLYRVGASIEEIAPGPRARLLSFLRDNEALRIEPHT